MVVLREQRPPAVPEAVDDVHLPQRPGAVHRPLDDPADLFGQLVGQTGPGNLHLSDVIVQVEVAVGRPVRMVKSERHLDNAPSQRLQHADEGGELGVHGRKRLVVGPGPFEDQQQIHVPEGRRGLRVEEGGVQAGKLLHRHPKIGKLRRLASRSMPSWIAPWTSS